MPVRGRRRRKGIALIDAKGLVKRYGEKTAVRDLTFTVRPGTVTGFLGPNGSGKSTTMRMIVGLDAPTAGTVTVNGRRYADHPAPLREVGIMLEARAVHTSRSAYDHLLAMAATHGIGRARVDEVVDLVGLREVAHKRVGGFSLGMGQRLGIACALLGDPATVILDEPVNGLDPEGVRWVRLLLRDLAAEGRTVFVSSHLMSEMALTAQHLIVIGRGELIADASVEQLTAQAAKPTVHVRSPQAAELRNLIVSAEVTVTSAQSGVLSVAGLDSDAIGTVAARHGITLYELTPQRASLEEAFMELTRGAVEYQTAAVGGGGDRGPARRPHAHAGLSGSGRRAA
jgi:ABC-2 type transport system ATP-binding protein